MSEIVIRINIGIIIVEVLVAGVVWRINIDNINLAGVGVGESGKSFEIVALDQYMIGCISTALCESLGFIFDKYRQLVA